jgi:hypothetical protein
MMLSPPAPERSAPKSLNGTTATGIRIAPAVTAHDFKCDQPCNQR